MASAWRSAGSSSTTRTRVIPRARCARRPTGAAAAWSARRRASGRPPARRPSPRSGRGPSARPSPTPAPSRSPMRWNGVNSFSRSASGTPGPWSTIGQLRRFSAPAVATTWTGASPAVAQRVVEQVGQHALEQAGVGVDQRQVVGDVDLHALGRVRQPAARSRRRPRRARPDGAAPRARRPAAGSRRADSSPARRAGRPTPRWWPAARRAPPPASRRRRRAGWSRSP